MSGLVRYPCPLGDGRFCYLDLPNPLYTKDAERIIKHLLTIVLLPPPPDAEVPR